MLANMATRGSQFSQPSRDMQNDKYSFIADHDKGSIDCCTEGFFHPINWFWPICIFGRLEQGPYNWFQPIVSLNELKAPRLLSRHARIWSTVSIFILEIETFTLCLLWPYLNWERGVNSNLCLITLGSSTLYAILYRVKQGACREPLAFKTGSLKFEPNPCNESRFFLWECGHREYQFSLQVCIVW